MIAIKEGIWNAEFQFEFAADSLLPKLNFQRMIEIYVCNAKEKQFMEMDI